MKKEIISKAIFGFVIFAGLSALSFHFNGRGSIQLLLDTDLKIAVWILIVCSFLMLMLYHKYFTKRELSGLGALYSLVPFTFYFSKTQVFTFIFLEKHLVLALLYWAIAAVVFSFVIFNAKREIQKIS